MQKQITALFIFLFLVEGLHQQQNRNCNSDKNQYYDEIRKECRKCPAGSPRYNAVEKMCQCCPKNMIWNEKYSECICPRDKPVHNDILNYCTACPPGLQFDKKQNQCYHCPQGFKRGDNTTCVPMYT